MRLSEHFEMREFQCHDGSPLPENFPETIRDAVDFLERLRGFMNFYICRKTNVWLDVGLKIISGHRTLEYNRRIGSNDTSRHVAGQAADVAPVGGYKWFSYSDFYEMCELVDRSFSSRPYRLGKYNRSKFVHVDCGYGHGGRRWTGN